MDTIKKPPCPLTSSDSSQLRYAQEMMGIYIPSLSPVKLLRDGSISLSSA